MTEDSPSYGADPIEAIVLNGTSSSGKTTLAMALQDVLSDSWLVFGIDTLFAALPLALLDIDADATIRAHPRVHELRDGGIAFSADGDITVGFEFRRLEEALLRGLAAMAESGARLILDEVFLDGGASQERLRHAFKGRRMAWVGVTCDIEVAKRRERDRGDRVVGMVAHQSSIVHEGVHYDVIVDTTSRSPHELAQHIADRVHAPTI